MFTSSPFILPYEPGYTGHWEAEKRRKETKEWLRQREREIELRRRREREIDSPQSRRTPRKEWKNGGLISDDISYGSSQTGTNHKAC
jgi:hypothetical protein